MSTRSGKRMKDDTAEADANPSPKRLKDDDAAANDMSAADEGKPPAKKPAAVTSVDDKEPTDPAYFNDFLFALLSFKSDHGNYHASKDDNPKLHLFMQHLKREYKNYVQDQETSALNPEQLKVLEYLHVPLTSRGDDHWNRFYELLQQYQQRHGHVLVPRLCEVPGLGDWVTDQRRQYKQWKQGQPSQLTQERREKLEALDFCWQVRNRPEWDNRYSELCEYKEKNGDCKVPQHYKENRALGKWVAKQREQYKLLKKGQHSFLTPYRLEKLNLVGFVWSIRSAMENETEPVAMLKPEHQPQVPMPPPPMGNINIV